MRPPLPIFLLAFTLTLIPAAAAQFPTGGFTPGDLYLLAPEFQTGGVSKPGILRIDPLTGVPSVVAALGSVSKPLTFDAYRDRLVFYGWTDPLNPAPGLLFMDAAGSTTKVTLPIAIHGHAPTGSGSIYLYRQNHEIHVLRADDTIVPLLNEAGTGTFALPTPDLILGFAYDLTTNALFRFRWSVSSTCGYASNVVDRIPLTANGTQVAGPVATASLCLTTGTGLVGSVSPAPGGKFLVVMDGTAIPNGSNRIVLFDPATLTTTTFATLFGYFGIAREGAYSPITGRAVVFDSLNDEIRSFSPGQPAPGTTLTPSTSDPKVSAPGSAGAAGYLCAVNYGNAGLSAYGTGTPGCAGPIAFTGLGTPKAGLAGYRFLASNAPATSLGLVLAADAAHLAGADLLGVGILLHVDLLAATSLETFDIASDATGQAATAPFTIPPSLAGQTFYAQSIWAWTTCTLPPFGLSSSNGLVLVIQG